MKMLILRLITGAVLMLFADPAFSADPVTVRLKWFNQAQFAGFYVAKENGLYDKAGLDVSIQPGGPDFPAIQMVAGGNEQFGVSSADQILIARSKGVPVVALAVFYRKNPFVLFSLKRSGIDAPAKFSDRTIGVKIGGNEELIYRAVLKNAKVAASSLHEIPIKFDITPLLTGQIDVWPGYLINEVLAAREKGFELNIISPADYGVNVYADTLFTTEKMVREKPELVGKFVAATLQGWADAMASPAQAASDTVKYGSKLSKDHELSMMQASIPLLKPDDQPIGAMSDDGWAAVQALLLDGGFIKKPQDLKAAFTTRFLVP